MQQRRYENEDIVKVSEKQKKMRGQIDSTRNKKLKAEKMKERNKILNDIKELIKKGKKKVIEKELGEIESKHTDVSKCFEEVRLKRKKPKKRLIVYNGNGDMVNTKKQQTDETTDFFREIFEKFNEGTAKEYPSCSMKKPFTEEGISMASKKLRNGKSPGNDNMYAEYTKYAQGTTHLIIMDILRKSVETDDYLEILKEGILTPLQKPPKQTKTGEKKATNLRPVILLPTVRKIFAICIIKQTWGKSKYHIPRDQAAYQK